MKRIARTRDANQLIALADEWAGLMESEDYVTAYDFTSHDNDGWSPSTLGEVIKAYGDALPTQTVTVAGIATDISQRKEVTWYESPGRSDVGELWYDLNIDGRCSDLTAIFDVVDDGECVFLQLRSIHVM